MRTHKAKHNVNEKPPGKIVSVTYKLKKSAFVTFLANGFSAGYVNIDLLSDQETDENCFSTRDGKFYPCLMEEAGLQVSLFAEGKTGDHWSLELEIDGKPVAVNPIRVETDDQGHLDFDDLIKAV